MREEDAPTGRTGLVAMAAGTEETKSEAEGDDADAEDEEEDDDDDELTLRLSGGLIEKRCDCRCEWADGRGGGTGRDSCVDEVKCIVEGLRWLGSGSGAHNEPVDDNECFESTGFD